MEKRKYFKKKNYFSFYKLKFMQPKKNPNSDLRNYSRLLLAFGLCHVLFVSWRAIEFKTYEAVYDYESLNIDDDDDEEIPITEQIKTPPPPPPAQTPPPQAQTPPPQAQAQPSPQQSAATKPSTKQAGKTDSFVMVLE